MNENETLELTLEETPMELNFENTSPETEENLSLPELNLEPEESPEPLSAPRQRDSQTEDATVLPLQARSSVESREDAQATAWHSVQNAFRSHRILTGIVGGLEKLENGHHVAVVEHLGFRVLIPLKQMGIDLQQRPGERNSDYLQRKVRVLSTMIGAEIDFLIRGIDRSTHSIVASRLDAMLRKRQLFYFAPAADGRPRLYPGRLAEARIVSVSDKAVWVDVFGAGCNIYAQNIAWEWLGDVRELYHVGDRVTVRVQEVLGDSPETLRVRCDIKSVTANQVMENLHKCQVEAKYAGKVVNVYHGVVYVRLMNGVNAVAHSCYDHRTPGKNDDVSFVVTQLDEERGVAVGLISRIIRRNL